MVSGFYRHDANAGRVGLNLAKVLRDRRDKDNIVLADGDSVFIPAYIPTVRVEGAVNSPGSVTYVRGEGLDYYLSAAGGVSFKGDKKRVFVQQPNGNVRAVHKRPLFFGSSKPSPEPAPWSWSPCATRRRNRKPAPSFPVSRKSSRR